MKFELITENGNYSKTFSKLLSNFFKILIIIIFCDIELKLGMISRNYQILYNCKVISIDKSKSNYKKLSELVNIKSKQRIWEFCREVVK